MTKSNGKSGLNFFLMGGDVNHSEKLKKSLIKTRNVIKKKFRELHSQKLASSERFHEEYKPIIDPLKFLAAETKKKQQQPNELESGQPKNVKNEKLTGTFGTNSSIFKTALPSHRRVLFQTPSTAKASTSNATHHTLDKQNVSGISQLPDDDYDDESVREKSQDVDKYAEDIIVGENSDSVKKNIVKELNHLDLPQNELQYGLRTHNGQLTMGNDKVTIKGDKNGASYKYCIRTKNFTVTPGLTSLLLEVNPKYYTEKDLKMYKDMLLYTNAYKKNFSARGAVKRDTTSFKYNKIITQLFPERITRQTPSSGAGIILKNTKKPQTDYKIVMKNSKINYTYWDDPNELVDRLRLLLASTSAGHTGHNNEIISIIEELHEAKVIT